jgi:uncharacterized protein YodC (DUF2158 family)
MRIAMAFKIGDKVQLKSGGPIMTVQSAAEDPREGGTKVSCIWFGPPASGGEPRFPLTYSFAEGVLEHA